MPRIGFRILGSVTLLMILASCSYPRWGIRPDDPRYDIKQKNVCKEFEDYANYTLDLKEAYHSRATQNRSWIYVSGTTGLATVTATAALTAASSLSAGSLALVPIIGGFLSGVFAIADNPTLADIYTISANELGKALQKADEKLLTKNGERYADPAACASALVFLHQRVTETKNNLERARTDSAVAALQRATAQTQHLNQLAAEMQAQAASQAAQKGEITGIEPDTVIIGKPQEVTLTVSNIDLSSFAIGEVKVLIGQVKREVSISPPDPQTGSYEIRFMPPDKPPIADTLKYAPTLQIGKAKVESKEGKILEYKNP